VVLSPSPRWGGGGGGVGGSLRESLSQSLWRRPLIPTFSPLKGEKERAHCASRPARITALCLDFLAPPGVHAGGTDPRRCPMRLLAPSLVVAALMASASDVGAASCYDYPWTGVYTG